MYKTITNIGIIERIKTPVGPDSELTPGEKFEKYAAFAFMFYWSAQENSVGRIAGNLTVCTNKTELFYGKLEEITW